MAKSKVGANAVLGPENWQAQSDLDTLMRAEEIEADPKRYDAAKAEAKRRLQGLINVAGDKE